MRYLPRYVTLALLAGLATPAAYAGEEAVPPNWTGSATGTTRPEGAVDVDAFAGSSSHVGRFTAEGFHVLDPADFTFAGEATWTTADGFTLEVAYAGFIFPSGDPDYPFAFLAVLDIVGGSGRLGDADGQAEMWGAFTGVPGDFYFDFAGTLHPEGK